MTILIVIWRWFSGVCNCEVPVPVRIAAEAWICNSCKRRLWGEDFSHWV